MATSSQEIRLASAGRLGIIRVGAAAGLAATLFLLLCWIGARLGLGPATHMYIRLFSAEDVTSSIALIIGLCWSLVGGFVAGALFAWIYNLLAPLER